MGIWRGGHGGAHVGSHTGNENERQNHGGGCTRVIVDAHGRIVRGEGGGIGRGGSRDLPTAVIGNPPNPPPLLATEQQHSQQQQNQHQPAPPQQPIEPIIAPVMPAGPLLLDQVQIAADIRDVLRSRISKKSRKTYDDYNTRIIRFFFDNCSQFPNMIHPDLMGILAVAHEEDQSRRTQSGAPSKLRNSINNAIHNALSNIQAENPSTHPMNLENLNFHILACYMSTFSKTYTCNNLPEEDHLNQGW